MEKLYCREGTRLNRYISYFWQSFNCFPMKKNIALLSGGDSSEHDISVKSARQLAGQIDRDKYRVYTISIHGIEWIWEDEKGKRFSIDKNDFSLHLPKEKVRFDCAFIAIHGTPGEDGKLQAYFDLTGIPYTSSGRLTSALTFNKYFCKNYLANFGILSAKTLFFSHPDKVDPEIVVRELGLPCFVKPNEGGSSFGVSKVKKPEELEQAVEAAFREDREILIESYVEGREITCGLIKTKEREHIFPLAEIVSKNEFFDFHAKYTPEACEEIVPARIPEDKTRECQEISSRIYSILQCKGLVRIDYILSGDRFYFLEVNTIPGMTAESIVPKQIKAMGLSPTDVYSWMIDDALGIIKR